MNHFRFLVALATIACVAPLTRATDAVDPIIGTWTLDVSRSKLKSTPPKSETVVYESTADGSIKVSSSGESAAGQTWSGEMATYKYDGKDYPLRNTSWGDTLAVTRVDSHTSKAQFKRDGKPVGSMRCVVSHDGKALTETSKMIASNGKAVSETFVFSKH